MREELGERKRIDEGMRRRLGLGVEGERCLEHGIMQHYQERLGVGLRDGSNGLRKWLIFLNSSSVRDDMAD
ncbi:hypothetical protein F2Q69_00061280 [Brassica cretica]|uniref:Uncharacterized protein n=1 Tax=Brassica cretica TaxID=69181 RepID=A0A8S9RPI3_BRACR|nr:hypothetical protein F2Q69_00061280 [Brassica cretica]